MKTKTLARGRARVDSECFERPLGKLIMYLRKIERHYKGTTYTHYLPVESVHTSRGPRQRVVFSLGDLKPRPASEWLDLFERAVDALRKSRRSGPRRRSSVA